MHICVNPNIHCLIIKIPVCCIDIRSFVTAIYSLPVFVGERGAAGTAMLFPDVTWPMYFRSTGVQCRWNEQVPARNTKVIWEDAASHCPYCTAPFLQKIAPSRGAPGRLYIAWYLGPTRSTTPNGTSIDSAVFAKCIFVTNEQIHRRTERKSACTNSHFTNAVTRLTMNW